MRYTLWILAGSGYKDKIAVGYSNDVPAVGDGFIVDDKYYHVERRTWRLKPRDGRQVVELWVRR